MASATAFSTRSRVTPYRRRDFFGVNTTAPNFTNDKNRHMEAADIKNVALNYDGGFDVRPGYTLVNTSPLITQAHSIFWYVDQNSLSHLLLGVAGSIYDDGDGVGTPALSHSGLSSARATGTSFMGFFWYANGVDAPIKFDGTNWSPVGTVRPASAPGVVDLAVAGNLDGVYLYRYCYVYENAGLGYESESAMSDATAELTVSSSQVQVSVTASSEAHVSLIRIFRRSTTSTTWHLLIELANTTQNYTDNTSDANISANRDIASIFEGKPEVNLEGIVQWRNRLWGWFGNTLYHTGELLPEKWFSASSQPVIPQVIGGDDGEKIKGVFPYHNMLVIWTTSRMYATFGTTDADFQLELIFSGISLASLRTVVECDGILLFLTRGGVYEFDGVSVPRHVSKQIDKDYHGFARGLLDAPPDSLQYAAAFWRETEKEYWLSVPTGNSVLNDHVMVDFFKMHSVGKKYDVSTWSRYEGVAFGAAVVTHDGRVYATSMTDYNYLRMAYGVTDNGADFETFYESRWWSFGDEDLDKRGLFVTAVGNTLGPNILFQYSAQTPTVATLFNGSFYLAPGEVGHWDVNKWDEFKWASLGKSERTVSCDQGFIGEYFQFRIGASGEWGFRSFKLQFSYEGREAI